jgi:hypothetical protein
VSIAVQAWDMAWDMLGLDCCFVARVVCSMFLLSCVGHMRSHIADGISADVMVIQVNQHLHDLQHTRLLHLIINAASLAGSSVQEIAWTGSKKLLTRRGNPAV